MHFKKDKLWCYFSSPPPSARRTHFLFLEMKDISASIGCTKIFFEYKFLFKKFSTFFIVTKIPFRAIFVPQISKMYVGTIYRNAQNQVILVYCKKYQIQHKTSNYKKYSEWYFTSNMSTVIPQTLPSSGATPMIILFNSVVKFENWPR